jgi:hypothetical protein
MEVQMSWVCFFPTNWLRFPALCIAALLTLLSAIANAGSPWLTLSNGSAGYLQIDRLYGTDTPIAIGQVIAINGRQLPEPACLLIVAGTYLPDIEDLQNPLPLQAGLPQDFTTGAGGFPLRPILQILLGSSNNPLNPLLARIMPTSLNLPGVPRGYDSYRFAIEMALTLETTYCPPGSKVVVLAHSLGCMEMQRMFTTRSILKKLGLELLEADFYGCPELKALPESIRSKIQFFVAPDDIVAHFPDLTTALHNIGLPAIIGNALLPYDPTRTISDEERDLTQDWQVAQKITPVPSDARCSPKDNHTEVYKKMPDTIKLAPITNKDDDGSKTINADLHYHSASPDLDEILKASDARSCVYLKGSVKTNVYDEKGGSDEVKKWQEINSHLPAPPMVPSH